MNASDVTEMLRRHYLPECRPPGGVFAPEIGSPCGKRRADLIWAPTTIAGGQGLVGHEVKVSRADVLHELADPTKADPWGKYCTAWWLVVSDPKLIEGLDLPTAWGVMSPPSGRRTRSMTVLREAPKLVPLDPAPGFARLLAWQLYAAHDRIANAEYRARRDGEEVERLRRQLAEAQALGGANASPHAKRVAGILFEVGQRMQSEHLWSRIEDAEVVAALLDSAATRQAAAAVRRRLDTMVREVGELLQPFEYVQTELAKADLLGRQIESEAGAA